MCFLSVVGDGRQGYPEEAPYDAIHVGAAAATVPKEVKLAVLGVPGENEGTTGSFCHDLHSAAYSHCLCGVFLPLLTGISGCCSC